LPALDLREQLSELPPGARPAHELVSGASKDRTIWRSKRHATFK
jgi:hypothetical protein